MKEIKAYQCGYCSFYRKTKKSVVEHEKICFSNPVRRACQTCKFNVEIDYDINEIHNGENYCTTVKARFCDKKEKIINKYIHNCELWIGK